MSSTDVPSPPPGTRYVADWYVSRRFEEDTALRYLAYGHPVLLWGPRKQGCTWLCQHVARAWQSAAVDRQFVLVDFRTMGRSALASLDTCLHEIAKILDEALPDVPPSQDVPPSHDVPGVTLAERWAHARGDPKVRLTCFLHGVVLPAARGEFLLVLDHADLVHGQPFYEDVVGLLRSWADKSANGEPWSRLRLLVSVSVPPARLSTARYQSPFVNLSEPIQVGDFSPAQVAELVRHHGLAWTDADLERLMAVVGGQPYLISAAIDDVSHGRYCLGELTAGASLGRSSIEDHLNRLRAHLDGTPALGAAFASLAQDPAASMAPETLDDLIRLGVVTQDAGGRHPVRYRLYERLLSGDKAALDEHGTSRIEALGFSATNQDEFGVQVREALRTLRDPFALANNPLIHSEAVGARVSAEAQPHERAAALQALLIEKVAAIRGFTRGDTWYRTLDAAYLNPVGKHEAAAAALGMSYSTFRRNLATAIQHLVAALWHAR